MKKFIISCLLVLPMSSFAQSYMLLHNGVTLTTDTGGFVYDFNHHISPYGITTKGGNFFIESEKLITIDSMGILYKKDVKVKGSKGSGSNYIFNEDHVLHTVDSKGFHYITKDKVFKKIDKLGGNFFTVLVDKQKKLVDLYTVNSMGSHAKVTVPGLNPADITVVGSRYLLTNKGQIYTSSREGVLTIQQDFKVTGVKSNGGNFFIDSTGSIFTVSELGKLAMPILPLKLLIVNIAQLGSNYMLDLEGRVFVVDLTGSVWERTITTHDMRNVFIHSK